MFYTEAVVIDTDDGVHLRTTDVLGVTETVDLALLLADRRRLEPLVSAIEESTLLGLCRTPRRTRRLLNLSPDDSQSIPKFVLGLIPRLGMCALGAALFCIGLFDDFGEVPHVVIGTIIFGVGAFVVFKHTEVFLDPRKQL